MNLTAISRLLALHALDPQIVLKNDPALWYLSSSLRKKKNGKKLVYSLSTPN